ncbi:MAG: VKORC1/thioredoxin protein [archaeon GW2011_AR9]|nr:MAG: VKORC1/thioredoxin protein [archaeon GW2011_AR9]MBS3120787.1 hypothetical protein [Candidatus Woesearchaeota archaeon]
MISRKNIIQLVVLVVAVIGIILARVYFHQGTETKSPPTSNIPATPRMLTYTNPAYSIQYPTNWKKTQEKEEITFSSPLESSADTFQEKLSIGPLAGPSTNLDGFFKEYVDMLKKAAAVDNPSDTTLGGYPAHTVIFTVKPKDQPLLKMMQIFTQKGTKLYGITYRAEPDKYDANFATIQTMIGSFHFIISPEELEAFVTCLKDKKVTFYGASWCSHCTEQKELFEKSAKSLPYVECSTPGGKEQTANCKNKGIPGYPTWEFAGGSRVSGLMTLQDLAKKSGCTLS